MQLKMNYSSMTGPDQKLEPIEPKGLQSFLMCDCVHMSWELATCLSPNHFYSLTSNNCKLFEERSLSVVIYRMVNKVSSNIHHTIENIFG